MSVVRIKDPDAVLDFAVDFNDILPETDSIDTFSVETVSGDIVVDSVSEDDGVVTAWLSGGMTGTRAAVRYRMSSDEGRTDDRTEHFYISEL